MLHELSFCCDALVVMLSALSSVAVRCNPHALEPATPYARGCNPLRSRLQPYVLEAAAPCARDAHAPAHAPVNACAGARDQCAPRLCRHSGQPALAHPVRACAHLRGQQGGVRRGSIAGSGRCRRVAFEPVLRCPWPCVMQFRGPWRSSKCWFRDRREPCSTYSRR